MSFFGLGKQFWGANLTQVFLYDILPHSKIGAIIKLAVFSIFIFGFLSIEFSILVLFLSTEFSHFLDLNLALSGLTLITVTSLLDYYASISTLKHENLFESM